MEINLTQRPSLPPAYAPVARHRVEGRFVPWAVTVPSVAGGNGISGSNGSTITGKGIPAGATQLAGDVRGVPPRGKPV